MTTRPDPTDLLKPYRDRINSLDDRIVDLLLDRVAIIREVGDLKAREGIPSILPDRVNAVRERAAARAADGGMDPDIMRRIYTILIDYSCALEDDIKKEKAA